jgi:hypothetical protein
MMMGMKRMMGIKKSWLILGIIIGIAGGCSKAPLELIDASYYMWTPGPKGNPGTTFEIVMHQKKEGNIKFDSVKINDRSFEIGKKSTEADTLHIFIYQYEPREEPREGSEKSGINTERDNNINPPYTMNIRYRMSDFIHVLRLDSIRQKETRHYQ